MQSNELVSLGYKDFNHKNFEYTNWLVEIHDDGRIDVLESDNGEPEDQTFLRNFSWIADRLNRLNEENKKLKLQLSIALDKPL